MRAISKNTRKATAITLAAALVIAVYLNWQYARTGVTLEEDAAAPSSLRKRGSSGPKPTMKPWTAFRKR